MPHKEESSSKSQITCLTQVEFEHEIDFEDLCFAIVSMGHLIAYKEPSFCQMFKLNLLTEFSDVLSDELPCVLPPIRDIQYQIDLFSDVGLLNGPHYRMTPQQHEELHRQIVR